MQLDEWQRGGLASTTAVIRSSIATTVRGPALLCIHGFPTASWDWHKLWPALTARFRVIAAGHDRLRPLGQAAPTTTTRSATRPRCTKRCWPRSASATVHILAHDYGDTVAQELLARHDERARRGHGGRGDPLGVLSQRRPVPRIASRPTGAEAPALAARPPARPAHVGARFPRAASRRSSARARSRRDAGAGDGLGS